MTDIADASQIMQYLQQGCAVVVYFSLQENTAERQRFHAILDEAEKQRVAQFRFDLHRDRYTCKHGKLREILASLTQCSPVQIEYGFNDYGKPRLLRPLRREKLYFNSTSSGDTGAVALSLTRSPGFDIELVEPKENDELERIISTTFAENEAKWFRQLAPARQNTAFYRLWTCKEAYLKALGTGLHGGLNSFSVGWQDNTPYISETTLEATQASALQLYPVKLNENLAACLAIAQKNCRIKVFDWQKKNIQTL